MSKHIAAALLVLITAGVCAGQGQVSLADAAKHKTPSKKATLVVNEDTISSIGGVVSVVGKEPGGTGDSATVTDKPVADKKQAAPDQAAPSNSTADIVELKKQLDWRKSEAESWKQAAKRYEDLLATETDEFRRQTYETALANDRINAEHSQKQVDEAQAALDKAQQAAAEKQQKETAAGADKTQ